MRRERRKNRILRRLVLGLAVAALVAPAAQARLDGSESATQGQEPAAVIHGDDKVIVTGIGAEGLLKGDDKTFAPTGTGGILAGDDKVIVPGTHSQVGYRRALPQDHADPTYSVVGYRRALPQDFPANTVTVVRSPSTFNWGDAMIGAGGALALVLLAGGLAFSIRNRPRTAAV